MMLCHVADKIIKCHVVVQRSRIPFTIGCGLLVLVFVKYIVNHRNKLLSPLALLPVQRYILLLSLCQLYSLLAPLYSLLHVIASFILPCVNSIYYLCIMKTTTTFHIRQYGRTELALLYSPTLSPSAAWRKLKLWIDINQRLTERLHNLGYQHSLFRSFTPLQVSAIVEELGEPF